MSKTLHFSIITTPSGNSYLNVTPLGSTYLLFLSDKSHVHVSAGLPVAGGWHRMEGMDASQTAPPHPPNPTCNNLYVHPDPHAIVTSANFSLTLQPPPAGTPAPYNQNRVAGANSTGDIWMANDGGVYHANGASPNWRAAAGLSTLATINVAGIAVKGLAPALYFGTGDNGNFFSLDGGDSWDVQKNSCGDCDAWFADPAQVQQVMGFMPYASGGGYYVFTNNGKYPDARSKPADTTTFAHWVCPTDCDASSGFWSRGYRPMVLTLAGSDAPATGDYVVIGTKSDGSRVVFRKTNANPMNTIQDWENTANAVQYGPNLPGCGAKTDCLDVVQASGGHTAPVLYAGDPGDESHFLNLWKWVPGTTDWQQIVPSPNSTPAGKTAAHAHRFYVDPYNPNTVYLQDDSAIKRSDDGGATWQVDVNLDNAATENHRYSYVVDYSVIKDMIFARGEKATRFAVGDAGVFYTVDGINWRRLLSTSAFPSHPVAAYFDNVSDPCDRALYVGMDGRGILRIDPIPPAGPITSVVEACTTLALKPPNAPVPNLIGLAEGVARNAISAAGYAVATVTNNFNSAPAGTVISQNPSNGVIASPGSGVSFTVSAGGVIVPNFLSSSGVEATSILTKLGLVPKVGFRKACVNPGDVLTQSPQGGTLVGPNSTVSLTVDSGTTKTCIIK